MVSTVRGMEEAQEADGCGIGLPDAVTRVAISTYPRPAPDPHRGAVPRPHIRGRRQSSVDPTTDGDTNKGWRVPGKPRFFGRGKQSSSRNSLML